MALVAKDFQTQTQWALVAIPAPIYFVFCLFAVCVDAVETR